MMGWRTMALKAGRDGLKGDDDWTVRIGGDDDGEKGGSAAIKACIEKEGGVDVCVVVSRWYGGESRVRIPRWSGTVLADGWLAI
jgi:hypothetical protein